MPFFLRAAPVPRRPLFLVAPLQAAAASAHEGGEFSSGDTEKAARWQEVASSR
jgi:hypothetical protein